MSFTQHFPGASVAYEFQQSFSAFAQQPYSKDYIYLVDENVLSLHQALFAGLKVVSVPSGESHKSWAGIEHLANELIQYEAHRKTTLVGIGGGLTTDVVGFLACVYMRGVKFGFFPTSVLGMVDAAVGGKNGINLGHHKNMLGTITQPQFIAFDTAFLSSLPDTEWSNGFAEIIKYGFIVNDTILEKLHKHELSYFRSQPEQLSKLIEDCVKEKNKIVVEDEKESGMRKLLNFGHTAGHAFETLYKLPHGYAVALGMQVACILSEEVLGLDKKVRNQLTAICRKYGLPVTLSYEPEKVLALLKMDKKRTAHNIDYILLEKAGKAVVQPLNFDQILKALEQFVNEHNS